MVKVSVIMPVYNVEDYLEECLTSVVGQTLKEIEIICINDGSTDDSLRILHKFAANDPRIQIISKENTGYGHSVNIGLDKAEGQYVSIIETDDFVDASMLEEMYGLALKRNLDMLKADSRIVVSGDGKYEYTYRSALPKELCHLYGRIMNCWKDIRVFQGYVYTWAGIYKREFLNQHHIRHNESPGASYQDNGFWFQTTMYAEKIYFLDKAYYNLRRDNPNSSIHSKEKVFCICNEYDFIRRKILESAHSLKKELLYQAFYYRFLNYVFTMQRIESRYVQAFFERMQKDIDAALKNGEIDAGRFTREQWNYIYTVITQPKSIFLKYDQLSASASKHLQRASSIWIYGAGEWGIKILELLNGNHLGGKIKGFIVSDKSGNPSRIGDWNVYSLDELGKEDCMLIVIAVADRYMFEIQEKLKERSHTSFLTRRELFR